MTLDPNTYAFASARLAAGGWTYDVDVMKLAELVQDLVEDFEADIQNDYEEAHHDRS